MAENSGEQSNSLSQKRSWVSCLSQSESKSCKESTQEYGLALPISKRSRSEQDFTNNGSTQSDGFARRPSSSSDLAESAVEVKTNTDKARGHICDDVIFSIGDKGDDAEDGMNSGSIRLDERNPDTALEASLTDDPGDEDDADSVSEVSSISSLSLEGVGWRPVSGPLSWVHQQMSRGVDPRRLLKHLLPKMSIPFQASIPDDIDQLMLWKVIINIVSEPPKRKKLPDVNTLNDAIDWIKQCKNIVVLTGAGVSVSCGIPDFRSRDGIYARLAVEYPDLPDPQAMFDIHYFKKNQKPFFKFAKEIYPGQFEPSRSHKFIHLIESHGKLLRNYTQNIDTLEQQAGIQNIIQCHGSFATATCMVCKYKKDAEAIREQIMDQTIPRCPNCPPEEPLAIMKPDIVFFGESLSNEFHDQMEKDKDVCDLLIVIGSSLKVRPVALIPNSLPATIPQILINREPLHHLNFDIQLLGDCDIIVQELCHRLGQSWQNICCRPSPGTQISRDDMSTPSVSSHSPRHHPTPPNSEDNTRMSFQVNSEDSRMSVTDSSGVVSKASDRQEQCNSGRSFGSVTNCDDSSMSFDEESRGLPSQNESCLSKNVAEQSSLEPKDSNRPRKDSQESGQMTSDISSPDISQGRQTTASQPEINNMGACWKPRPTNLASKLKGDVFLFLPPNRYVFKGAEVYDNIDEFSHSDSDSDCSFDQSSSENENEANVSAAEDLLDDKIDYKIKEESLKARELSSQSSNG